MRPQFRLMLVMSVAAAVIVPMVGAPVSGAAQTTSRSDAVLEWNATATSAAVACGFTPDGNPPYESRLYAMTHIAIHDALNEIRPLYRSYSYNPAGSHPHASPEAAVAAAANAVLTDGLKAITGNCVPPVVTQTYNAQLAAVPAGSAKDEGIAIGLAAARSIIRDRADDLTVTGAPTVDPDFPQGDNPGEWRFTPDSPQVAFLPNWGKVRPFTLARSGQFGPSGPYDVRSSAYARDYNEIKRLGGVKSQRTPDQTEIALFWVNSAPLQWNAIARSVTADRGTWMGLWGHARLFAVLNAAMADGYIGSFNTKYLDPETKLFWRPVTAIQLGNSDGNPATKGDPRWKPLRVTPPIPDYDSAHATEGGAAAAVLTAYFGHARFAACSVSEPATNNSCVSPVGTGRKLIRHYSSFLQAANENALSRIYVGYHFRKAAMDGDRHGLLIGAHAVATKMRPLGW